MKLVEARIKKEVTFCKYVVHNDIEYIKKNGNTVGTLYRKTKIGEIVTCTIYETQNYFLGIPYYDVETKDGYHCKVSTEHLELI